MPLALFIRLSKHSSPQFADALQIQPGATAKAILRIIELKKLSLSKRGGCDVKIVDVSGVAAEMRRWRVSGG